MKINTFEELTEAVSRLNKLLAEPQFGLMSWCMLYGELMKAITDYWKNN